jgi:hypothetical protein
MLLACADGCPPEDVGGRGGYEDFLHAVDQYDAMRRWRAAPFDRKGFDVNVSNPAIRGWQS